MFVFSGYFTPSDCSQIHLFTCEFNIIFKFYSPCSFNDSTFAFSTLDSGKLSVTGEKIILRI